MNVLVEKLRDKVIALNDASDVADEILALVGDARFVLLGEASHGTHEFYRCRAEITKRLIAEKNFSAVAVEADFPDAYRVNRFVHGIGKDLVQQTKRCRIFKDFRSGCGAIRWCWILSNGSEKSLMTSKPLIEQAGFYGIDLYSLHSSIHAVLEYLEKVDPEAARRARHRYSCFDHYGENAQHMAMRRVMI